MNERHCVLCGQKVPIDANRGTYRRHMLMLGGRRTVCTNSGRNAMSATDLGWPRSAYKTVRRTA